jgi:hypothetical protein
MKLIWHKDNLVEGDWLRYIFGDLIEEECIDLKLTCFDDDSIHVVSGNSQPLPTYEDYFRECRTRCRHLVLYHASDEWFSGGYALYRHFDAVIRNYMTDLAKWDGIWTIPVGYANGTRTPRSVRPITERQYAWSFIGQLKTSRIDMTSAFAEFEPKFLATKDGGRNLSKAEFNDTLENTVYLPCPMGNVILETLRLYESLEFGCIPLVENRPYLDYFTGLFGPHPIPTFQNWPAARHYAQGAFANKSALLRKQWEIRDWWITKKHNIRLQVRDAVTGPSQGPALQRYAALARNRYPTLYEPQRLAELLRHQTGTSLMRRLARPAGPLRRIAQESLRNFRT